MRISASVDAKTAKAIEKILVAGKFRNKSHVIESAVDLLKRHEEGRFVEALKELGGFEK
jgi:Arc/MetJ-type ribon-helix-helix transcriptional regulator